MKKKIFAVFIIIILLISVLPSMVFAVENDDIIILYENDVHCAVEGYSKLSALKKELQETHSYVGVVSGGDYIQGTSLGVVSKGEYIVNLMNLVGYDALTLGNHEFDYRLTRLEELIGMMNTVPVCCNFMKIGEETSYFEPYSIITYGDVEVAYIGITTPSTVSASSPAQFKDENGNYIYTFSTSTIFDVIQSNIDAAEAEGADYIIGLTHIGYAEGEIYEDLVDIETLIKNTSGFDVILDAHSHSVIEGMKIEDEDGNEVLLSSTGTKFENIGKLTISDDGLKTELIQTADYNSTDPVVDAYIEKIYSEYSELGERKVGYSDVKLFVNDENGNRLVRNNETNLGDFVSDAYRYIVDADIGYVNGGGLRANITEGDITFNDLLNVHPYNNSIVLGEVTGQTIKDMMEMALRSYPSEEGAFPHVSGLIFSVNTSIPTSVVLDEYESFVCVDGQYRVYDLKVYNKETDKYEPIDLDATYTLASTNYNLVECGSGMKMLESAKILQNDGILDVEALEMFITDKLGGTIGSEYEKVNTSIKFTDGEIVDVPENNNPDNDVNDDSQDDNIFSTIFNFLKDAFCRIFTFILGLFR